MRTLPEILKDLNVLTVPYSFRFVLSRICVRDFCGNIEQVSFKDVHNHLNNNEFFFLLGLWVKNVDLLIDEEVDMEATLKTTYELMSELHQNFLSEAPKPDLENPDSFREVLMSGTTFKESFFYAGTGAYDFQYAKWVSEKYKHDEAWVWDNLSIRLQSLQLFFVHIKNSLHKRLNRPHGKPLMTKEETLDLFCFDKEELCSTNPDFQNIIDTFSCKIGEKLNQGFNNVGDYNILSEKPIIELTDGKLFIPQPFNLAEALYETPFYLMNADGAYKDHALRHRGECAEEITNKIVNAVYGAKQTFQSIKLCEYKGKVITDIDVFAVFNNTAIIFQVKSKKLTALSKQGNVEAIQKDFQKAVRDALAQGLKAKEHILNNENLKLIGKDGKQLVLQKKITQCEVAAITLENYPAIAYQSRLLLTQSSREQFPVAMTIFDLEVIAKYLKTPQQFFEYFYLRRTLSDYFITENEMGYLGFHLQRGLRKYKGYDYIQLDQTWTQYIDSIYYPEISQINKLRTKEPGRNDPCPCGSGKKYKRCHGMNV